MDIENIIYSVIPLVLIVFFSWLFSVMGSRMKKQAEEGAASDTRSPADQLMDIFERPVPESTWADREERTAGPSRGLPEIGKPTWSDPQAPRVGAKPITPKWWGA